VGELGAQLLADEVGFCLGEGAVGEGVAEFAEEGGGEEGGVGDVAGVVGVDA